MLSHLRTQTGVLYTGRCSVGTINSKINGTQRFLFAHGLVNTYRGTIYFAVDDTWSTRVRAWATRECPLIIMFSPAQ